jgi:archaeosine synthase
MDERTSYVDRRWPVGDTTKLRTISAESMDRRDVRRFMERVVDRYTAPRDDVAVLLPCSARKPYSESQSHGEFRSEIGGRAHEVVLTSPIGVVPRELEQTYPAGHYDTPVTGRWTPTEVSVVGDVLGGYLERNGYDRVVAHVERDGYGDVVERAVGTMDDGPDVTWTVDGDAHPRDDDALERLSDALDGEDAPSHPVALAWRMRGVADYQWGEGAFDDRFDLADVRVEGRLPRPRLWRDDEQLATLSPEYGMLALTRAGADAFDVPTVTIDDFVPSGSVLAPGVLDCHDGVRVGDEVAFDGPSARGVGRARMFDEEMTASTRGVAVDVRHVDEK